MLIINLMLNNEVRYDLAFYNFKGSQAKSYSIKAYAHLPILPLKIGFCKNMFYHIGLTYYNASIT